MNPLDPLEPTHLEQASLWWVRLREDDVTPEQISRWLDWCQSDPENLRAFDKVDDLGGRLEALTPQRRTAVVRAVLVVPGSERKPKRLSRAFLGAALGLSLAASIAAVMLNTGLWQLTGAVPVALQTTSYVTRRAQGRDVWLVDGSQVAIGADSALAVDYTATSRKLQLNSGEAYFQVQHNQDRPFVVQAGRLKVIAVGTAFNIRKTGDKVEVIVTRGVVDVEDGASQTAVGRNSALPKVGAIRVAAGRLVEADRGSSSVTVRAVDTRAAVSWRSGSMSFLDEDLALVVANLNRYSEREVQIADPTLEHLRFTGSVVQGHEDEWLAAIQKIYPVLVQQTGDGRAVLFKRATHG